MKTNKTKGKSINSQASMDKMVRQICDIMRRDKAKGARLYVPELTWVLFLCYLDIIEIEQLQRAQALGKEYTPILESPYRWYDWAAPYDRKKNPEEIIKHKGQGWKRLELRNQRMGSFLKFVNEELFPYLMNLKNNPSVSHKQKITSEIFSTKKNTILDSENNLQDVLDKVHDMAHSQIDETHMFPISQAFEGILPSLGEKKNDGGQFFTPREVIRVMVDIVQPHLGCTVYDPCCGTGGFLIEAYKHLLQQHPTSTQIEELKTGAFWGREDADEVIPILLANLLLHDIDLPHIWHGNTLTDKTTYGELFLGAPNQFDYILTNPPFGSKESLSAQARFAYKSGKAQILFLQHIIDSLAEKGTCGMVIDEGVLFHTKTKAYEQTKRKLLNECDLFCIISLPGGAFVNAGAGVKTDLLFFKKGKKTERVWYYDMTLGDDFKLRKVNKGNPLLSSHFSDCVRRLSLPQDDKDRISERSWFLTREEIEDRNYDLKAVNNNAPDFSDKRTSKELLEVIRKAQEEIGELLKELEEK
ncbi:MAG TPA: N-6 DNA methylase [Candidatus Cloacimonadota bacterium]|nr:N-6 DNA methylase [Candidatus Cloacimonadota bacterium]HPT70917.1 N-6 DNA methylase [Candidatus Cloacimonadota bacterium]